jgi:hypothetical protein
MVFHRAKIFFSPSPALRDRLLKERKTMHLRRINLPTGEKFAYGRKIQLRQRNSASEDKSDYPDLEYSVIKIPFFLVWRHET